MISFPYTSVKTMSGSTPQFDRAIDSKVKRLYNQLRYKQGVSVDIGGGFQVLADTGMKVKVHCDGSWGHVYGDFCYEEQEYRSIQIDPSDSIYDRIDRIMLRNDISQAVRSTDLYYVKGTPSSAPEPPALTTTPEIHEICIAQIQIPKNSTTISQSQISDTRTSAELCGILTNAFGEIDASQFFKQLEQLAKDLQEEIKNINAGSETMLKATYDPNGRGRDIFSDMPYLYKATFNVDSWSGNGPYTQTVPLTPVDGGPAVTADSTSVMAGIDISLPEETRAELRTAASIINEATRTLGAGTISVSAEEKPDVDAEIYFWVKKGEV